MPECRSCGERIVFVELLKDAVTGETNGKALPVDISPAKTGGGVSLSTWPPKQPGFDRTFPDAEPRPVGRRMTETLADYFRSLGGVVYAIHFDTCKVRNAGRRSHNNAGPVCERND